MILLAAGIVFVVAVLAVLLVNKLSISSHVAQEKSVATTSLAPAAGVPAATETQSTEAYTLYVLGISLVNDDAVSPEIAVKSIEEALVWP